MPVRKDLMDRLASSPSREGLAPIVATGPMGERVAQAAVTLRAQLSEPIPVQAGGGLEGMQLTGAAEITSAVNTLLRANHPRSDVVVDLFGRDPSPALLDFQQAFLDTAFVGTLLLAAGGEFTQEQLDDLIRVGASVSAAGGLLRGLLGSEDDGPPRRDLPRNGNPFAPGIPEDLLLKAESLRRKGCVNAVRGAMSKWGDAVAAATPRYLSDAIDALDPPDGCPGDAMTILGSGFGDGSRGAVVFTGAGSRPVLVAQTDVRSWTDTEIQVRIPNGAVRGPVGIILYADTSGGASLGELGSTAVGELGDCFGPAATARLEGAVSKLAPPVAAPPLGTKANLYTGGVPEVLSFTVSPSRVLWPGRHITLSWQVAGAKKVEIVARAIAGSAAHELPPITAPMTYPTGTASVTVPGTRKWHGEYVLRVSNPCGTSESAIDLEMAIRRGLALGGGGTRGDFQVGALLYLYNEKGFRPDAIAGTSVGSVNAVDLVMGDDEATATTPARSAASRLAETWLSLTDESSMWGEEPWLKNAKAKVRKTLRSFSVEGLLSLPYAAISGSVAISDLVGVFKGQGQTALLNMAPIEARMRVQFDQARANKSGIKLRLVAVSLESTELIMVDETGGIRERGAIVSRPATVPPATASGVIEGAMASASMPGIFPAVRLNNHMCVDGGIREQVPAQVAVQDMGCNEVYSLRLSAAPTVLETNPTRQFGEIIFRSMLGVTLDEISDDDVLPYNGWGDGVKVTDIRPTFNIHDGLVIDPGLIRISMDYGWMRAADAIDVPQVPYAHELSDRITLLRLENWKLAHWASSGGYLDPNRGFTNFIFAGVSVAGSTGLVQVPDPGAVQAIRDNCRQIRALLEQRLITQAPTPASAVRSGWFTNWEIIGDPPSSNGPWAEFISRAGTLAPEPAPAAI